LITYMSANMIFWRDIMMNVKKYLKIFLLHLFNIFQENQEANRLAQSASGYRVF
jgi:hypothetical protein